MKRITIAAAAAAALTLVTAPAAAQGSFEGVVTVSITGMPGEMQIYQQGEKMRQEMSMQGMSMASIVDAEAGEAIMLMPAQKRYMKMSFQQMEGMARHGNQQAQAPDLSTLSVTPTGQSETVAGIECDHYLFKNTEGGKTSTIDICGAKGMGFMGSSKKVPGSMLSTATLAGAKDPDLAKLAKQGFFPLKMTMEADGKTLTWEVKKVEQKKLDSAMFGVPAGYSEMKMPGQG